MFANMDLTSSDFAYKYTQQIMRLNWPANKIMEMIQTEGEMLAISQRAARCSTRKHLFSSWKSVNLKNKNKGEIFQNSFDFWLDLSLIFPGICNFFSCCAHKK